MTMIAVGLCALAWSGVASAANGDNLRTIIADTSGTTCPSVGTGIAFDGTNLLLSCWSDSKIVAINPADGSQVSIHTISGASGFGAIAWDNGRHVLWACKDAGSEVGTIDLTTNTFTSVFNSYGCTDGLAYDGSDDTIWSSADVSPTDEHWTTTGTLLMQFFNAGKIGGCGNSGIAVGGPNLYLANNGCSQIYTVSKDFSTSTLFATFPARLEDLECDNVTFAPVGAIWSKDAYDNTLNAWEIPADSCLFGGGRSDVTLTPTDATNDVGTTHTVTANVSDHNGPIEAASVLFTVTGANPTSGTGTTDASGNASFTYTGTVAGDDSITACYDKNGNGTCDSDESMSAAVTKHWIIRNADLSVVKSGPAFVANGGPVTYTITVTNNGPATAHNVVVADSVPASITGATATPSQGSCSGSFSCNLGDIASGGTATITIHGTVSTSSSSVANTACASSDNPDPDTGNNCSTTRATVFTMGTGGGAFVVGDLSATGSVTFWGAQWWKLNSLSGGSAPAAFKGFASAPASPACGVNWTTAPGNSPPPPAGPLPALMGVIVSSSISQSGSTISGNTVHIVIVQTNPGYDANPGHAGTGTVIATYC
jgi:uncharacterized repeat protein (TIGR01451 family)